MSLKLYLVLVLAIFCCNETYAFQQNYESVKIESPEDIAAKFGDASEGLMHESDLLTFMFHSDAVKANLTTMFEVPFKKYGRSGPWLGQVKVVDSDRLLMSFAFTENENNGGLELRHYRGENAPAIPVSETPLKGKHFKYRIKSKYLEEFRNIEVYLPNVEVNAPLPVLYLTDGRALGDFVGSIEWKIRKGDLQPLIVVAVHSGGYRGDRGKVQTLQFDYRAREYLALVGDERYESHRKFLFEEVIPYVEKNHNVSSAREQRAISGYSNGGACVLTLSIDDPSIFGHVFSYSVAAYDQETLRENVQKQKADLPKYRFAAGTLERFMRSTRASHKILSEAGVASTMREYVAGHDPLLWQVALLSDLEAVFPGPNNTANAK